MTWRAIGLLVGLGAILSLFDLGFLGGLFSNLLRLVVGNTYQFGALLLGALGCYWLLFDRQPKLRASYLVGGALLYLGVLLWIDRKSVV